MDDERIDERTDRWMTTHANNSTFTKVRSAKNQGLTTLCQHAVPFTVAHKKWNVNTVHGSSNQTV